MNAVHRLAGSVGAVLLGLLLLAMSQHTEASHGTMLLSNGRQPPPGMRQPGLPPTGRPLYSPPAFTDRGTPISERPFAKPFSDRSPSIADRPLSPIGGGNPSSPDAAPQVWCQGRWMRADQSWLACPPR